MEFSFYKSASSATAIIDPDGTEYTGTEILGNANAIANSLRALGLSHGDTVAMVLGNGREVFELYLATCQIGLYLIPVNWHLAAPEVAYILQDAEAKVVVCSPEFAPLVSGTSLPAFCTGEIDGFRSFDELREGSRAAPADRSAGGIMNYTSGTTGKPKGVKRPLPPAPPEPVVTNYAAFLLMYGLTPGSGVHLVSAPLYHTAVLYFASSALHLGHALVVMGDWSAEGTLSRIERYRVDSSHMVPTHFIRLLAHPGRQAHDVSSLRAIVHSAAPCPVPVKHQMLDWWGDCIYEYYAATEGGGTMVGPADWKRKPGTVGRPWQGADIAIHDDDGRKLGPDQVGTVYIKMAQGFEYHRDKEKTAQAWDVPGYFTVGDVGYLDSDGFLFLCDRKADMIISGGVNIYPAEIEAALVMHPRVLDVAVFGIPDDDWGEQVKAVVEVSGDPEPGLDEAILAWVREQIAGYKVPRTLDFTDALPREPNGKLKKRLLRDPYWDGRQI